MRRKRLTNSCPQIANWKTTLLLPQRVLMKLSKPCVEILKRFVLNKRLRVGCFQKNA